MAGGSVMLYGVLLFVVQTFQEKAWTPASVYSPVPVMTPLVMAVSSATEPAVLAAAAQSSAVMAKVERNQLVSMIF